MPSTRMTLRDKCRGNVTENDTCMDTVPQWQLQRMDWIKTRTWGPLKGRGGERQRRSAAAATVRTNTCTRHTTGTGTLRQPGIWGTNKVVGMIRSLGRPGVPLDHHRIRNMKFQLYQPDVRWTELHKIRRPEAELGSRRADGYRIHQEFEKCGIVR